MSGWAAFCFILIGMHVDQPVVVAIAILIYAFNDSPRQRCEKLERRIKALERKISPTN